MAGAGGRLFEDLPDWLPAATWLDFVQHRKEKRLPVTSVGEKRILAKLKRLHDEGQNIQAVLDRSMELGYTGVFAVPAETAIRQTVAQRAILAWAEVRAAVKCGRGKVWSDAATAQALDLIGGWQALQDMRSDQAQFVGRNFERVFAQVANA